MFLDLTPEFTEDLNDRDWVMQSWRWMSDRAGRPWNRQWHLWQAVVLSVVCASWWIVASSCSDDSRILKGKLRIKCAEILVASIASCREIRGPLDH